MKRRAFLAAGIGALAGCLGRPGARATSSAETSTATSSRETSPYHSHFTTRPLQGSRTLSVRNVSQGTLGEIGVTADVKLPVDTATAEHPPYLRMTLTPSSEITVVHNQVWKRDGHFATGPVPKQRLFLETVQPQRTPKTPTTARMSSTTSLTQTSTSETLTPHTAPPTSRRSLLERTHPKHDAGACWTASFGEYGAPKWLTGHDITPRYPFVRTFAVYQSASYDERNVCYYPGRYHVEDRIRRGGSTYHWSFDLDVKR